MKIKIVILSFFVIFCSFSTVAAMYKCTDKVGKVSYSSSPCKEGNEVKEIKKPYFNEANQQQPTDSTRQTTNLEADNLKEERATLKQNLDDALARDDQKGIAIYSKLLKATYGSGDLNSQNHERDIEMQNRIQSEKSNMENQMRMQRMQMENQQRIDQHRTETLQRLQNKGY